MDELVVSWHPVPGVCDASAVARFVRFVDITGGPDACWPWTGSRMPGGYGRFHYRGRVALASRFALDLALGRQVGPGLEACHTCDNPPCCNERHLFEGTRQDNVRDMMAKGRHRFNWTNARAHQARGERIAQAKLTDEAVRDMRRLNAAGISQERLGRLYGVHPSTVCRIVRRKRWGHVA